MAPEPMSFDDFEETRVEDDYDDGVEEIKFDVDEPVIGVIVDIEVYLSCPCPFAESESRQPRRELARLSLSQRLCFPRSRQLFNFPAFVADSDDELTAGGRRLRPGALSGSLRLLNPESRR